MKQREEMAVLVAQDLIKIISVVLIGFLIITAFLYRDSLKPRERVNKDCIQSIAESEVNLWLGRGYPVDCEIYKGETDCCVVLCYKGGEN